MTEFDKDLRSIQQARVNGRRCPRGTESLGQRHPAAG